MRTKLAKFLQAKRLKVSLTQKQVSTKLGYTTSQFVSNWEQGISTPPPKAARKLVSIYKVNIDEIYKLVLEDALFRESEKIKKAFGKSTKIKD